MFYYLVAPLRSNAPLLTYCSAEILEIFEIVEIEMICKKVLGLVVEQTNKPTFACKSIQKTTLFFNPIQIKLAYFIAQYYCASYGESFGVLIPSKKQISGKSCLMQPQLKALSLEQQHAFEFCLKEPLSLIFGDTGSGKTEVYFHLIAKTLQKNQKTLFLMPEISLTPQIEKRLKDAFGTIVAIWHSKITAKEKRAILDGIQQDQIKIIAGARSALFLPMEDLGLIIVDEEHDDAYKSQSRPRYQAKDLCIFLAKNTAIKVVLGSATPSLQSYLIAKEQKQIFRLKGGFFKTQKQIIFDTEDCGLSPKVLECLTQSLHQKEQIILFVPTRANFKILLCRDCGESVYCKYCSVAMSVHHKKHAMLCHYCGFSTPIPQTCPLCSSSNFLSKRIGTAQILSELKKEFPKHQIAVFDKDHASTNKKLKEILKNFQQKKIDILIGTQMISKGHDFDVGLAVVLGVDFILKSPDFRCHERALNLLYQVAGRSGRRENGKVLIQSLHADFLQSYLHDYEDFLKDELENRKNLYPPFKKLALLQFENKNEELAREKMLDVVKYLQDQARDFFEMIGYGRSGVQKIANTYRYHILLRMQNATQTLKILRSALQIYKNFEIDINPISLL